MGITPAHTITVSNINKMENKEDRIQKIIEIAKLNIANTKKILQWNVENNIKVYRMSSRIIPLATWEGIEYDYFTALSKELERLGDFIQKSQLRISFHPDHFSVINTPSDKVFSATKRDLQYHVNMLKAMELDKNYKLVVHVGGTYGDKEYGKENFINRFRELPQEIQERLILENDDRSYHCMDVLDICGKINIPMVVDVHHYRENNIGENLEDVLKKAFATWQEEKFPPKIHYSSPRDEKDRRAHADYINTEEFIDFSAIAEKVQKDFDVMLEAKAKDLSVIKLRNELYKRK